MTVLKGKHIQLRALEPEDLEYLFALENDPDIWEISGTLTPYSRKVLRAYLDTAHQDIYQAKQLRLAIAGEDKSAIGLIDLYDFDPRHLRAGIGIVISQSEHRNQGFGGEALTLLCSYAFSVLDLHQLYAGVSADNLRSIHLFEKLGFKQNGVRKDWLRSASGFKDELFFQKIRPHVP
jgi:diamine N-acetyltransferase